MPVLSDARTIPSKFSMPASYFRAPRTVKIEWGGRALPLHISIFGRSGIPSKRERETGILAVSRPARESEKVKVKKFTMGTFLRLVYLLIRI